MKTSLRSVLGIFVLLFALNAVAGDKGNVRMMKKLYGTWTVAAPEAPYGYQEAELKIYNENGEDKVKIITDYDALMASNLKVEGKNVSFEFELENIKCLANLVYKKWKLTGMVETDQGDVPVTMEKKK